MSRRIYLELVRGRTRVRVVADSTIEPGEPPRFVLSPYRSGTTLLRYALDSHPNLVSPPETDFLAPLATLLQDAPSMQGLHDLGFDEELVRNKLRTFARSFLDTYAVGSGADAWVDKSPRYAEDPFPILDLFPRALVVALHRHPLDQVHSFTRGGTFAHPALSTDADGHRLLVVAAQYWADVTENLLKVQDLYNTRTLSIRYEDLCATPEPVLRTVLAHMRMPWDQSVLEYDKHPHDVGREAGRVIGAVGFSRSSGGWRRWDERTRSEVWAAVESAARKLGYEPDGSFSDPAGQP